MTSQSRKRIRSLRRGTVLVIVMVLLLVTMSIALAVFRAAVIDARQFRTDANALQADRLAEGGLARADRLLHSNPTFQGDEWSIDLPNGGRARVVTHVERSSDRIEIEAIATFPLEGTRSVRSRRGHTFTHSAP